jgi:hypothetical protein
MRVKVFASDLNPPAIRETHARRDGVVLNGSGECRQWLAVCVWEDEGGRPAVEKGVWK